MADGAWLKCCKCTSDLWLPKELYGAALKGRDKIEFYCAYGHSQHLVSVEKEAELKKVADEKRNREATWSGNIISFMRRK